MSLDGAAGPEPLTDPGRPDPLAAGAGAGGSSEGEATSRSTSAAPSALSAPSPSRRRIAVVFFGILLGTTLSGLDSSIVATAAPTIIADLGQLSLLPWLTSAYLLCQVTTMPLYGKLGDIYGRRRVFTSAILVFLAGSALCGLASSMGMLIVARGIQGLGAGGITGLGMALVADLVPAEKLGRYLGYTGLVFAVTSVLGPFAGGWFVENLSWRWAFYINAPLGVICLVSLAFHHRQSVRVRHRIDLLGALLLGGGLTCLLLGLSHEGEGTDWAAPGTIALFAAAGAALGGFVWWERRATEPLLPMRILANRTAAMAALANLVAGVGFTCGIIYPPVFFQAVAGVNAANSGLLLAPFAFTCALSTVVAGQITDRTARGFKAIPLAGMGLLAVGYGALGTIEASTPAAAVVAYAMVGGIGVGFVMQTLLFVVQRLSKPEDMGVATSTVMLARVLGGSLGVAILGSAFTGTLASEVRRRLPGFEVSEVQATPERVAELPPEVALQVQEAFATGLATAFRVAVPIMVVGIVAVAVINGRRVAQRMAAAERAIASPDTVAHGV